MISIVIPNLNGLVHLKACYDSLLSQSFKDFEIILVDNNSTDGSIEFTEKNYPLIKIIRLDSNTGFAKAVNAGISRSGTEFVLLLNNDTACDPEFLSEMMKGFKRRDTGSVACKMLNFNDRTYIDDAGDFIKKRGSPYARGYGEKDKSQYDKEEYIFGACAGAALYKKEVFDKVGLFDEDFFAYYEDVDFSFRMQMAGYKCFYNPKALCYHKRGATTDMKDGYRTMLCEKNLIALRLKNYPLGMLISNLPFFWLVRARRYFLFLIRHSPQLFFSAVKGFFMGILEIPKSLKKRPQIQSGRKVSIEYLESILK
ncbi:MAG: glycosyltransferase family 2 protein [bacterium]